MPDNLPNQNNSNPWDNPEASVPNPPTVEPNTPASPAGGPNPPQSPPNSNNTVDPVQSWVAQHEQRDSSGKFVSSEHLKTDSQTTPTSPNTPTHPNIPLPVSFTQNNKYSEKNDPPLVAVSVTNPITYLKLFIKRLLKNEGITIKIKPLTAIAMIIALSTAFGTGFNVARIFFPTSSPILHRSITLQGNIQRSDSGQYYLSLPDNSIWTLRPTNNNINLANDINRQVMVKGNMTAEANVIEVKEVITFDKPAPVMYAPTQSTATNSASQTAP